MSGRHGQAVAAWKTAGGGAAQAGLRGIFGLVAQCVDVEAERPANVHRIVAAEAHPDAIRAAQDVDECDGASLEGAFVRMDANRVAGAQRVPLESHHEVVLDPLPMSLS
jgi:hypothetical protein